MFYSVFFKGKASFLVQHGLEFTVTHVFQGLQYSCLSFQKVGITDMNYHACQQQPQQRRLVE